MRGRPGARPSGWRGWPSTAGATRRGPATSWPRAGTARRGTTASPCSARSRPASGRPAEPFLEAALDDRKAEVREQARRLLARLPESAFVARAADRARGVLRRGGGRLAVTLPEPPDAGPRRDGLTGPPPPGGIGASAWHLFQVVAR